MVNSSALRRLLVFDERSVLALAYCADADGLNS